MCRIVYVRYTGGGGGDGGSEGVGASTTSEGGKTEKWQMTSEMNDLGSHQSIE